MALLHELVSYTDALLNAGAFKDYCPNGLQVEGRAQVHTLVSGVSASVRLLDAALALKADAIVVHHGYFWKGEDARVIGYKKQRLQRLLSTDVSLLAYHLPLDAHPELGNNAQLAQVLKLNITGAFDNSPYNPFNPDPSRTVTFGEQTTDEMFIGYYNYSVAP